MIAYSIVVRSTKVTVEGADVVEYVLAHWPVPDDMEFDRVMREMAQGFRSVADKIDAKIEDL